MATVADLARKTLKEKWYRESETLVVEVCAFCDDSVKGNKNRTSCCKRCKLPGGKKYVCDFILAIPPNQFSQMRVCDLTYPQFAYIRDKIEALIP